MYKRKLVISGLIFSFLFMPALAFADSSVKKLKDPAKNLKEQGTIFEEIIDQGNVSIPELISLLEEEIPPLDETFAQKARSAKVTAMNLLGELNALEAVNLLGELLENSDEPSEIYNAARAIGRIGGTNAFKILKNVLINTGSVRYTLNDVRKKAAIIGLGLCGDKKAAGFLQDELNNLNNDEIIRIYAAGSLGMLGMTDGLDAALAGLSSNDPALKLAAIRALGIIGSDASVAALSELTKPQAKYVHRLVSGLALTQIRAAKMVKDKKTGFLKDELLKNPHAAELVAWGTMELKKINTPAAKKALKELSEKKDPENAALSRAARIRYKTMP